eukprot:6209275-Pleurochrysis_carterae.AAC.4
MLRFSHSHTLRGSYSAACPKNGSLSGPPLRNSVPRISILILARALHARRMAAATLRRAAMVSPRLRERPAGPCTASARYKHLPNTRAR